MEVNNGSVGLAGLASKIVAQQTVGRRRGLAARRGFSAGAVERTLLATPSPLVLPSRLIKNPRHLST